MFWFTWILCCFSGYWVLDTNTQPGQVWRASQRVFHLHLEDQPSLFLHWKVTLLHGNNLLDTCKALTQKVRTWVSQVIGGDWVFSSSSSHSRESACIAGHPGSFSGSRSPGEGNGYPLQYSCLNFMDRGSWWAALHAVAESDTTEWLTLSHFFPLKRSHFLGAVFKLTSVFGENFQQCLVNSRFSSAVVSSRSREEFEHG